VQVWDMAKLRRVQHSTRQNENDWESWGGLFKTLKVHSHFGNCDSWKYSLFKVWFKVSNVFELSYFSHWKVPLWSWKEVIARLLKSFETLKQKWPNAYCSFNVVWKPNKWCLIEDLVPTLKGPCMVHLVYLLGAMRLQSYETTKCSIFCLDLDSMKDFAISM
jgi:hypothetical protein